MARIGQHINALGAKSQISDWNHDLMFVIAHDTKSAVYNTIMHLQ